MDRQISPRFGEVAEGRSVGQRDPGLIRHARHYFDIGLRLLASG